MHAKTVVTSDREEREREEERRRRRQREQQALLMVWCDVERKREREEEEEEEEEEEDEDEDDDEEEDEEMTVRKGAKRKRGHECDVSGPSANPGFSSASLYRADGTEAQDSDLGLGRLGRGGSMDLLVLRCQARHVATDGACVGRHRTILFRRDGFGMDGLARLHY